MILLNHMKKPLLVANWKMGVPLQSALHEVKALMEHTTPQLRAHGVVCPSFVALQSVREAYSGVMIGAQDCAGVIDGAATGEVSAADLRALGCSHVIIGHSERRIHQGETDAHIAQKMLCAHQMGLRPILCIGETKTQRTAGETFVVIRRQLEGGLKSLKKLPTVKCLVAYEPLWAIGAKKPASLTVIAEVHAEIVRWLRRWSGARSVSVGVLYGGAVDASTIRSIVQVPNVDGVLVGRASYSGEGCAKLLHAMIP